jgi:hypothetical protein
MVGGITTLPVLPGSGISKFGRYLLQGACKREKIYSTIFYYLFLLLRPLLRHCHHHVATKHGGENKRCRAINHVDVVKKTFVEFRRTCIFFKDTAPCKQHRTLNRRKPDRVALIYTHPTNVPEARAFTKEKNVSCASLSPSCKT